MNPRSTSRRRRLSVSGAAAAVALLSAAPGISAAHASGHTAHAASRESCPAAESLVPRTTFHHHTLAPGVVMSNGVANDSTGSVDIHVLKVDLSRSGTSVEPLLKSVAQRSPLSALSRGRHLVAATNTGYFDFISGAPTLPLIDQHVPLVLSTNHESVVGFGAGGRAEAGKVWLSGTLTAPDQTFPLVAINETYPPNGIAAYTHRWGSQPVRARHGAVVREVVNGVVGSANSTRFGDEVPTNGELLVARGASAERDLSSLSNGTKVGLTAVVKTNAASPFVQAYGVGLQIVAAGGKTIGGFGCDSANTKQPARTAIGFANGGRTLVIGVVAEHPYTSMHGLDENQMSELMAQLGASQAYAFDGSGSTELLAKLKGKSALAIQNYPADGEERPMPLGLGISVIAPKHVHNKHSKTKHKHKH